MRVVVRDEKADDSKGYDIEQRYTPENLFNGGWKRFAWVFRLSRGETNQFCTGKGESCCDEDTTKTFEAVIEGAGIVPHSTANITLIWTSTAVENYSEDAIDVNSWPLNRNKGCLHVPDDCNYFDYGEHELRLTIAFNSKQVYSDYNHQEYRNKYSMVIIVIAIPVVNGNRGGYNLEW